MLRVLSKEESFELMNQSFAELEKYMLLDLYHEDRRFPCIVYDINAASRKFWVYPLTRDVCSLLCEDGLLVHCAKPIEVALTDSPSDRHPAWNVIKEQL